MEGAGAGVVLVAGRAFARGAQVCHAYAARPRAELFLLFHGRSPLTRPSSSFSPPPVLLLPAPRRPFA